MLVCLIIVGRHEAEDAITLQDLGNVGEFIAAIGVVISLVYLAFQIRQNTAHLSQNTQSVRLSALDATLEAGNRVRELVILNPELAELFIKGLQGFEHLDNSEQLRIRLLLQNFFSTLQATHQRFVEHGLDPAGFSASESMLDSLLASPGVREWWKRHRSEYRVNFAKLIDERLSRLGTGHAAQQSDEVGR